MMGNAASQPRSACGYGRDTQRSVRRGAKRGPVVGQLEQVRESLRRAYENGLDTVRAARAETKAAEEMKAAEETEAAEETGGEPLVTVDRPVVVTPASVNQHDDLDVPRGLRVAGAWAWRILLL